MAVLAVDLPDTNVVSDRQLVRRYVRSRDEGAFADLVERHTDLVRRVCRTVLVDEHACDEVVQDTFLLLARKAPLIPWQQSIGSWLGAAAYRLAQKSRCLSARRRNREHACIADEYAESNPLADLAKRELHGALDDELRSLPRHYRVPLELCYLDGKTNRQAANELGWPAGSMARRLAKARAILQRKLVRRGFVVASLLFLVVGLQLPLLRKPAGDDVHRMTGLLGKEQDFESILAQLAKGERQADSQLLAVVRQTADLADRVSEGRTGIWKEQAQAMGRSAQELAQAIEAGDNRAVTRAASQLHNSCVQCHNAYRQPSASRQRQPTAKPLPAWTLHRGPPSGEFERIVPDHQALTPVARQVMISYCGPRLPQRNWMAWNGGTCPTTSPSAIFPPRQRAATDYNELNAAVLANS